MKHDLEHEMKQNEALKLLAQAVEGVAEQCGWLGAKALAMKVEAILAKDEADVEVQTLVEDFPSTADASPTMPPEGDAPVAPVME